jgi:hypothetical protein
VGTILIYSATSLFDYGATDLNFRADGCRISIDFLRVRLENIKMVVGICTLIAQTGSWSPEITRLK